MRLISEVLVVGKTCLLLVFCKDKWYRVYNIWKNIQGSVAYVTYRMGQPEECHIQHRVQSRELSRPQHRVQNEVVWRMLLIADYMG